ncbi:MAG: LacI family transcriptional regulator [Propionibacteriaceae bacterium]|jgi:DNA-binding LacI/PurR family transcriptional regulator|nr:LacI family transcriptional regulator [Propionibacteriaceae bacterium]
MIDSVRPATIQQVAKLAGVSHQTVSRYIRGGGAGVRPAIQERVQAAIDDLDYRPSLTARAMRTRRSGRLAILLPEGPATGSIHILHGATSAARQAGYDVDVVTLGGSPASRGERVLELIESQLFERVLSLVPLPEAIRGRRLDGLVTVVPVYDDEMRSIGRLAGAAPVGAMVERLAEWGHRRFVHLAGGLDHTSARCRRDAYLAAIDRLGLESYGVLVEAWSGQGATDAILNLPADAGVTAVIAANDVMAVGAMRGAVLRGWTVPGDLSVTGYDDSELSSLLTPSLTTVQIDRADLGRQAMSRLLAALKADPAPTDEPDFMTVVWRDSTGPAPRPSTNVNGWV